MQVISRLEDLVKRCEVCSFVDKPYLKQAVYRMWLPKKVKVLIVVESPPPSRKENFFYNLSMFDRLRLSMKTILSLEDLDDREFLCLLRERGVFVTNAVKCRPMDRVLIPEMRRKCVHILEREIRLLKPKRILAMGKTAVSSISEIFGLRKPSSVTTVKEYSLEDIKVVIAPHPNFIFRFRREISGRIKPLIMG